MSEANPKVHETIDQLQSRLVERTRQEGDQSYAPQIAREILKATIAIAFSDPSKPVEVLASLREAQTNLDLASAEMTGDLRFGE